MPTFEFLAPEVIMSGMGSYQQVGTKARQLGSKALIVSDPIMENLGRVEELSKLLSDAGLNIAVYTGVTGEPTDNMVDAGLGILKKEGCDLLVALGGGSVLDTAKAIGMLATNGGNIVDYMGLNKVGIRPLPLVAIPTTAGTGSEVTKVTIITDTKNDVKMLISSPYLVPTVAIVDAELTLTAPKRIIADCGIDALCHAIEAYVSRRAQPMTDIIAMSAIKLLGRNLRQAWANPQDLAARDAVMLGAMQAGLAFSNASVTLIHGMSRPIGAVFHVPHGLANAMLLPTVMEYSWMGNPQRFADVAAALGENIEGYTAVEAAQVMVDSVTTLCRDLQIPTVSSYGIDKNKFIEMAPKMAEDALISGSPGNNLRVPTKEEIIELYKKLTEL